jgi:sirohydrochlorin ferrochelatase
MTGLGTGPGNDRGDRAPVLLAVAHGTRSAAGQAQIRDLVDRVACRRPDLDVRLAYVDVQQPRVGEAIQGPDAVVLAAAGSSDPAWRADIASVAGRLGAYVAYASGSELRVPDVVAGLRAQGARRITIAAYLLAEGLFYRSLHRAGADVVTPPLCADPAVVDLVLTRYQDLTMAPSRL